MAKFSLGRRNFTLAAAAAATTAVIRPADALAGFSPSGSTQQAAAPSLDEKAQSAIGKLSPSGRAEVEMKFASIVRKYGNKLTDEQKADIRRSLAESQDGLEKMRAFVLDNGDQPATIFQCYRNEGKK